MILRYKYNEKGGYVLWHDFKVITPKRDIARELARKYSTMTHDELDVLERYP